MAQRGRSLPLLRRLPNAQLAASLDLKRRQETADMQMAAVAQQRRPAKAGLPQVDSLVDLLRR